MTLEELQMADCTTLVNMTAEEIAALGPLLDSLTSIQRAALVEAGLLE